MKSENELRDSWRSNDCVYIQFPDYEIFSPSRITEIFTDFSDWLEENIGSRYTTWNYHTGDRCGRGIYFVKYEDAVAFRLRFQL